MGVGEAGVAELADAQDLGSCGREAVQVRFLSPAFRWRGLPEAESAYIGAGWRGRCFWT